MANFTKQDANDIGRLLKKMTSEFDDAGFQKKLISKAESVQKATEAELDIQNGGAVASDLMTNIGLLIPYALQSRPKYVNAVANLLTDASKVEGGSIDEDVSKTWEQMGVTGLNTESLIRASMESFNSASKSDKPVFEKLIKGLIGTSARNKGTSPLHFALSYGEMDFMAQYSEFTGAKANNNNNEFPITFQTTAEVLADFSKQQKSSPDSLPPQPQNNVNDQLNNAIMALGGVALAGTLYYVSKKIRNSYKEQQAQKSGQELIEAEEQSKAQDENKKTSSKAKSTKSSIKKDSDKKSVRSGSQNNNDTTVKTETTTPKTGVPKVISFQETIAPAEQQNNEVDRQAKTRNKTATAKQSLPSPDFTAITASTAIDSIEPLSLDGRQERQPTDPKDQEIALLKKDIQKLYESSNLKDSVIANQKKALQAYSKSSKYTEERLKKETERADRAEQSEMDAIERTREYTEQAAAATRRADFSENNEKSLKANQAPLEQQNNRLNDANKFLIKKAKAKDQKIARLIREQNRPLTTNEEKARAYDEGHFRGSMETWGPAHSWGYAQRANEDQGYIGYLENTVQDLVIKVQHAYYDGMVQGLEQSKEMTQAQLLQAEERGFHRGANLDYKKFYEDLQQQVKAEKERQQQNNNESISNENIRPLEQTKRTRSQSLERKAPISPEAIEEQNSLKRSRSFS